MGAIAWLDILIYIPRKWEEQSNWRNAITHIVKIGAKFNQFLWFVFGDLHKFHILSPCGYKSEIELFLSWSIMVTCFVTLMSYKTVSYILNFIFNLFT